MARDKDTGSKQTGAAVAALARTIAQQGSSMQQMQALLQQQSQMLQQQAAQMASLQQMLAGTAAGPSGAAAGPSGAAAGPVHQRSPPRAAAAAAAAAIAASPGLQAGDGDMTDPDCPYAAAAELEAQRAAQLERDRAFGCLMPDNASSAGPTVKLNPDAGMCYLEYMHGDRVEPKITKQEPTPNPNPN